eukprot:4902363-Prymnesium_polylepis.2
MPRVARVTEIIFGQSRARKTHGPARGHKWSRMRHRDSGRHASLRRTAGGQYARVATTHAASKSALSLTDRRHRAPDTVHGAFGGRERHSPTHPRREPSSPEQAWGGAQHQPRKEHAGEEELAQTRKKDMQDQETPKLGNARRRRQLRKKTQSSQITADYYRPQLRVLVLVVTPASF